MHIVVEKIVSGGQSGTDIGALKIAKELGYQTGGWIPKGFLTEDGPRPQYSELYGLVETEAPDYRTRTYRNVRDSDFTLIVSNNAKSPGTRLTISACKAYKRPYYICYNPDIKTQLSAAEIQFLLKKHNVKILNVAGNRESVSPGIEQDVKRLLRLVLSDKNSGENST